MDSSTSPEAALPVASESRLDTVAAQTSAIDQLIGMARNKLQVFDIDLSQTGWGTAARAANLAAFLRRAPAARFELILHDTRWMQSSCPRLVDLLRLYSSAITVYQTGIEARVAMDPLVIVDARHFLHRFHIDQPRASLVMDSPQQAMPLVTRFEEIWATGEPGLAGTVLGL
ncbi:MAG: hypothetical protein ABI607_01460 [Betaproteobacteria bacterium]